MTVWCNGKPVTAGDAPGSRALGYGDGVFRTVLVRSGVIVDAEGQFAHLLHDAAALELQPDGAAQWQAHAAAFASVLGEGALRITLSRRDTAGGYAPATPTCDVWFHGRPLPPHTARSWRDGVILQWSPVLLGVQPRLAGIKHCNRLEQVLASRNWQTGQDEALMCDAEGRVICGSRSNVFFVIDGVLVTPALRTAGVAGRMRARVIELSLQQACEAETGTLSPDEVRHASEAFLTSSLIGIWPVRQIGSLRLPAPGPVTERLQRALAHPWNGA